MVEQALLCLWCLLLLTGLAFFVRYEERDWGDVPPIALLLVFLAIPSIGVALVTFLQPWSPVTAVGALLLLVSLSALFVGTFARWIGALAITSLAALLVSVPPVAMVAL